MNSTRDLKIKFLDAMLRKKGFTFSEGNPFKITIKDKEFYIFVKNISPAYFANLPDITRVQLPYNSKFDEIINSTITFAVLGFDIDNNTVVCWDPRSIKSRLNSKDNVSLYSRLSFQRESNNDVFTIRQLSNGDNILLLKTHNLIYLFENLDSYFTGKINAQNLNSINIEKKSNKIDEIEDKNLLKEVVKLLDKDEFLEAVKLCMQFYRGTENQMTFKDWSSLIKKYHN